jgi:hypothetical protein
MILPIALLLAAQATDAGGAEKAAEDWLKVQAKVSAAEIRVGEPFHLVIEAEHAPGALALLPEELSFGDKLAERRSARRHTRAGDASKEVDRYDLEILAFEDGDLAIPKIPLALGSTRAETNEIALDVKTHFSEAEMPIATSTQPEAIAELEKMAASDPDAKVVLVDDWRPVWIGGTALAALLIAFGGYRAWKKREARIASTPVPAPPPRPAHEVALERLEALGRSGRVERGELKAYFVELSEILRDWAGARYGFDSLELTMDELMLELSKRDTRGLQAKRFETLLTRADLVKFAKYVPDVSEATDAMGTAVELVERAKPIAPVRPEGGGEHAAA